MKRWNVTKCYVVTTLTKANKNTCQGYRVETLNGTRFNVMRMMEGVILQEIVLRPWSDPPYLQKLCFPRGRKRNFNGSYGLHMT